MTSLLLLATETTTQAAPGPAGTALAASLLVQMVCIAFSAAFSGSESVLFSHSPAHLQSDARSGSPLRRLAATLMRDPKRTLMVILLGNTAANVAIYASAGALGESLTGWFGAWGAAINAAITVLVVTIGAEVTPKIIGVRFSSRLAPWCALFVRTCGYVLGPISGARDRLLIAPLTRLLLGVTHAGGEHNLSTAELKTLLDMSRRGGVINPTESEFLRSVLDLNSLRVVDVMTPRVEVTAFDVNGPPDTLRELMRRTRRKRVPVYEGSIDNVIGLVYAKILFLQAARRLRDVVMPVRFVPQYITCEQLLHHFRGTKTQMAVVVDEYGGMAGVVALEDVLEAIVGDIHDARDEQEAPEVVQVSPTEYDVSGKLSVHFWAETFGLPRLADRVSTVGGLITSRLGRPARIGDVLHFSNIELEVTSMNRRRVNRLRLRLQEGGRP
ncbi:MAG: HlyC/CorC family transporter [Planctomycetes bacterium]|nr:HlyC/CorC family transporter [Planctomycetota bacterium]